MCYWAFEIRVEQMRNDYLHTSNFFFFTDACEIFSSCTQIFRNMCCTEGPFSSIALDAPWAFSIQKLIFVSWLKFSWIISLILFLSFTFCSPVVWMFFPNGWWSLTVLSYTRMKSKLFILSSVGIVWPAAPSSLCGYLSVFSRANQATQRTGLSHVGCPGSGSWCWQFTLFWGGGTYNGNQVAFHLFHPASFDSAFFMCFKSL